MKHCWRGRSRHRAGPAQGAGHDAQSVSRLAPIGMIFVPSLGGISHWPLERSNWEDVANGAEVLYRTVLKLDGSF